MGSSAARRGAVGPGGDGLGIDARSRWSSPRSPASLLMAAGAALRDRRQRRRGATLTPGPARLGQAARRPARPTQGRQPGHHDRVPDRSGAHRPPSSRLMQRDPPRPPEPGRDRLGSCCTTSPSPARFVEQITDESWTEHLRRFHRATAADVALRERRLAFHEGAEPPRGDPLSAGALGAWAPRRQPALPAAPPAPAPARARRRCGSRRG